MVNFRFHLVSLTAVFLALAAGITIGAGVVDRATVDQIERRLSDVDARRQATNAENDRLRADLGHWSEFGGLLADRPVQGRLNGVTVFVVAASGIDRKVLDGLQTSVVAAGATLDGTLQFTGKWNLGNVDDARAMAAALDVAPTTEPDDLRTAALAAIESAWSAGDSGPLVVALAEAGFLDFQPGPVTTVPLAQLPRPASLFVVLSGDDADVPSALLAEPLVARLAATARSVLAVQPQRPPADPPTEGGAKPPAEFVTALRSDSSVAGRISTVDNVDDYRGRTAAVLALVELQTGKRGHYGFGADTRRLPDPAP
ncbi:MAG TPA: copper transporter [Acidimicrobiales bacterium]|nr:copper transporter [Acidimicrobiales bacterium]